MEGLSIEEGVIYISHLENTLIEENLKRNIVKCLRKSIRSEPVKTKHKQTLIQFEKDYKNKISKTMKDVTNKIRIKIYQLQARILQEKRLMANA